MGKAVNTMIGAVATDTTAVASGVCLGQVNTLNETVKETAKFTADNAKETTVRHYYETVGRAVGVAGTAIAAGVTLG